MSILIASIIILGIIAAAIALFSKGTATPVVAEPSCATCTGDDEKCEQECILEAATKDIEYFDDEELDRFADRPSDKYTDSEINEFADVMYTLKKEEVKAWNRSLILRRINMPDELKDEFIALVTCLTLLIAMAFSVTSCSTQKNTAQSRWWHSFNARYNTYYNGAEAYIAGSLEKEKGNKDNFTEMIPLYTIGNKQSIDLGKSNYETAITKSQKAIKQHSIKKRPEWTKNRKKTERDIEWLNRKEYNPFLWKAWMLMGRSQFYKGAFDEAAATFSYMSRIYRSQPAIYGKARAWLAKCYIEQNWLYDAEDVIRNMTRDSIDWRAQKEWDYTLADYYVHVCDWKNASEYLRKVIRHERRSTQRAREWFLLGQVYGAMGNNAEAYKSFKKVVSQNPPYELEFNARIAMTEVMPGGHSRQKINRLKAMARSDKNKDYLDQVYYAMGNVYLADKDTMNAIGAYESGNEKATRSGVEKGVLLLHLGDLYWDIERFSDAHRCYGQAIGMLDKERPDYEELSHRSKILDELVPHTDAVHLQDSLQALAQMSEKDRNAAIDRVIEVLKKKEKEEKKKLQEQEAEEQRMKNGGNDMNTNKTQTPQMPTTAQGGQFYFYNPTAVQQGKQAFQQRWGNRRNEDNWQRMNKTVVALPDAEDIASTDSLDADGNPITVDDKSEESAKNDSIANDPHKREYYLAQIPFTQEQLDASNKILSDGLFNSGIIFKDKLDNLRLSEKNLLRLTDTFTDYEKTDEALYHLYLLYARKGDMTTANAYLSKLKQSHADSPWTAIVTDPYFFEDAVNGPHLEDSLYSETYEAFKADCHQQIARNYKLSESRFGHGAHHDKFIFINGLSRLNQNDADSCLNAMKRIVKEYPQSEVSSIAGMIVKGVESGKKMHGAKFDIGSLWDLRSEVLNGEDQDSTKVFTAEKNTEFVFLMTYNPDSISTENQLLYELARYNFTNYLVRNFDIDIEEYNGMHRLSISGFRNHSEAMQYTRQLFMNESVARIASKSRNIIISTENLKLLGVNYSYNDYDDFYNKHFAPLPVPAYNILNDPVIDPKLYDPEEQPLEKKDDPEEDDTITTEATDATTIIDDVNTDAPQSSATEISIPEEAPANNPVIDIPAVNENVIAPPAVNENVIDTPAVNENVIDTPAVKENVIDIPIDETEETGTTTIAIDDNTDYDDAPSVRQQINSEIIDIIDEESKSSIPANKQEDDDEYFDFDGF